MQLFVIPGSLEQREHLVTGTLGNADGKALLFRGKPILFTFDLQTRADILIPHSLDPIYPLIEDAVVRYFLQGKK